MGTSWSRDPLGFQHGHHAGGAPTRRDARFCMSRANASKSGMGMWPRAYLLKWSSDASLVADIVCGGAAGGGRGGGSVGGSWCLK